MRLWNEASRTHNKNTMPELENRLPPGITAGFLDLDLPASRPVKSEAAVVYEFALL